MVYDVDETPADVNVAVKSAEKEQTHTQADIVEIYSPLDVSRDQIKYLEEGKNN